MPVPDKPQYQVSANVSGAAQVVTLDSAATVNGAYVTINVVGGGMVAIRSYAPTGMYLSPDKSILTKSI